MSKGLVSSVWGQALFNFFCRLGPGNSTRELEHKKFHMNMRKSFFTVRETELREVVESPVQVFKTYLEAFLHNLL